jgi:hypothetical protein
MKKVRYAAGAIGVAPALGLMLAPAAQAAPASGHPARSEVKRVSLAHTTSRTAATECQISSGASNYKDDVVASIFFNGHCIAFQRATLTFRQSGLTERVRYYGPGGKQIHQSFVHGHFDTISGHTYTDFSKYVSVHDVYNAWFALVANGNHNDVEYGPVHVGV